MSPPGRPSRKAPAGTGAKGTAQAGKGARGRAAPAVGAEAPQAAAAAPARVTRATAGRAQPAAAAEDKAEVAEPAADNVEEDMDEGSEERSAEKVEAAVDGDDGKEAPVPERVRKGAGRRREPAATACDPGTAPETSRCTCRRKSAARRCTLWSGSWGRGASARCTWGGERTAERTRRRGQTPRRCDTSTELAGKRHRRRSSCFQLSAGRSQVRAPQQQGLQLRTALRVVCVQVRRPPPHLALLWLLLWDMADASCALQLARGDPRRAESPLQGPPRRLLCHGAGPVRPES